MYIRSRRVPYSRGFRPREQAGRGGGRGARVFLPFSRRACNGTKVATLCATCHVHSVLRIHAWHYVCARHQRAADGPLDAPFLFESSTTSLVRAPCAALLYQMPVTSESMVVITVNVTGWASTLSAEGRENLDLVEEIEREFIPVVFHDYFPVKNVTMEIELYLVPSELTSLESVMSVKHVSSIEGNRFIDMVFDIGWYRCVYKCIVHWWNRLI